QNLTDYDIVRIYGAEYRGVVNYYLIAQDVWRFSALRWNAETSMLKTLAAKHQATVAKTAARYKAKVDTGDGPRTCFEARFRRKGKNDLVARFGGIPLRQARRAVIPAPAPGPAPAPRKELITRLRKRRCELCEHGATVAVHQVAKLAHLGRPGPGQPAWAALMAKMRRKTLIVCAPCHEYIHANPVADAAEIAGEPGALNGARRVRREAARKRPKVATADMGPRRAAHPAHEDQISSPMPIAPAGGGLS